MKAQSTKYKIEGGVIKVINTIYELLSSLKDKGIAEIEPYLNIQHNPTIGDMYEGLTKELVNRAIFKGLDLRVCSGKIKNIYDELSRQIDCMIVVGEGDKIPFTNDYIYEVNKVVAVIEVKKNLFTSDLDSAYNNLKSVSDIAEPNRNMDITMLRNAFKLITKTELPEPKEIEKLSFEKQMIYHSLVMECFLPARIIFGYDGFKSEYSLRENFIKYIYEQMKENGYARGFGAVTLPNLIICGENSLIKTNGFPYVVGLNTDDWLLYASYNQKPLLLFLEIIWTKLSSIYSISSEIFGVDIVFEVPKPLLIAIPHETGWEYINFNFTEDELKALPESVEWEPVHLSDIEFCLMNKLCNGSKVYIDDAEFLEFLSSDGMSIDRIVEHLNSERLIYVDGTEIKLLTEQCVCMITPDGFFAGDNKDGRMREWSSRQMTMMSEIRDNDDL